MYIQRINRKQNGKVYTSIVLYRSYRENGKQKRETIVTLTKWPKRIVGALEYALKNEKASHITDFQFSQGKSFGGVYVLLELCKKIGINHALGRGKHLKTSLLQIIARVLNQGSQRSIIAWSDLNAIEEVLAIPTPTMDNLYNNLDYLAKSQKRIENKLFKVTNKPQRANNIYLYDVTSSYLEGEHNELAEYGYNRDKKKGKKQIVIGLLCDEEGNAISTQVFKGNTSDVSTFADQLHKVKTRFNCENVVMVGDKGMIKSAQIDSIEANGFKYITSISKLQIKTLAKRGAIQFGLFDEELVEIQDGKNRYILRRNPVRQKETADTRKEKMNVIKRLCDNARSYLKAHPRAKAETQLKRIAEKIKNLKLSKIMSISENENCIELKIDEKNLAEVELLDGCYAIKTNIEKETASASTVHQRYKDLAKVESAFKNIKTECLEVRPIFLRKEERTKAHVFICMLAYNLVRHIRQKTSKLNITLADVLDNLKAISYIIYDVKGFDIQQLPSKLSEKQYSILKALDIQLPKTL